MVTGGGPIADIYRRRGHRVRRAAWRRPLDVTDLGAFGPKVLLLPSSAQNTPPGCICGVLDYKAEAFYFLFLSQKESSKEKCSLRKDAKGVSLPAGSDQGAALDLQAFEKA
mgnify:CR=1 FL=1